MCYAIDAAMTLVNMSVDLAELLDDSRYYTDYIKVHKQLFLAQCFMLENYHKTLFHERITAHRCGPFVDGLDLLIKMRDSGPIKKRFESGDYVELTPLRQNILRWIVNEFGAYSAEELVEATKTTKAYQQAVEGAEPNSRPLIPLNAMSGSLRSLLVTWGPYYDQVMPGSQRA